MSLKSIVNSIKQCESKKIIFIFLSIISFAGILSLFVLQLIRLDGKYDSDLMLHITSALAKNGAGYSLEGKIIVFCNKITNGHMVPFCLFLALLVIFTPIVSGFFLNQLDRIDKTKLSLGTWNHFYIGLWAIFASPVVIPKYWQWFYKNTLSMNPWHNSTSLEMRFFSLLVLILYFKLYLNIRNGTNTKVVNWFLLSITLFISTWFKPSFFIGFVPMIILGVIIDYGYFHYRDWSYLKKILTLGFTLLPSAGILILQYLKLYGYHDNIRIIVNVDRNYFSYCVHIGLFLLAPVLVMIYNRKRIIREFLSGNTTYILIWGFWLIQLIYYLFLAEEGRIGGNWAWGLRFACFLVSITSFRLYFQNLLELRKEKSNCVTVKTKAVLYKYSVGIVLLYQLICGLYYFYLLLIGTFYYI